MGKDMEIWDYYFRALMFQEKSKDEWSLVWENHPSARRDWRRHEQQAFGRFSCSLCGHTWASVHVLILFQMKLEKKRRRGTVKMNILGQKCNSCNAGIFEEPTFSKVNINIILNNLLISIRKLCYGEYVADEPQHTKVYGSLHGPHQPENCEACHLGICPWTLGGKRSSRKTSPATGYSVQDTKESALPVRITIPESYTEKDEDQSVRDSCWCKCCDCLPLAILLVILLWYILK